MTTLESVMKKFVLLYSDSKVSETKMTTDLSGELLYNLLERAKEASYIIKDNLGAWGRSLSDYINKNVRKVPPVQIIGTGVMCMGEKALAAMVPLREKGKRGLDYAVILFSPNIRKQMASYFPFHVPNRIMYRYVVDHEYFHSEGREYDEEVLERHILSYYKSKYESTIGAEKRMYSLLVKMSEYRLNKVVPELKKQGECLEDKVEDEGEEEEDEKKNLKKPEESEGEEEESEEEDKRDSEGEDSDSD